MTAVSTTRFVWALASVHAAPVRAQSGGEPLTVREASRFLAQATPGADWEEIHRTSEYGLEAWLDEQFAMEPGFHRPLLDEHLAAKVEVDAAARRAVWRQRVMESPDALRQRVALALSEIFVVSDNVGAIAENPAGLADYHDMLLEHSFLNYRDLLRDVSLHPIMGVCLSHLRNRKSDPSRGGFPDENCAREIMQLLSIGLFELDLDGTLQLDGACAATSRRSCTPSFSTPRPAPGRPRSTSARAPLVVPRRRRRAQLRGRDAGSRRGEVRGRGTAGRDRDEGAAEAVLPSIDQFTPISSVPASSIGSPGAHSGPYFRRAFAFFALQGPPDPSRHRFAIILLMGTRDS